MMADKPKALLTEQAPSTQRDIESVQMEDEQAADLEARIAEAKMEAVRGALEFAVHAIEQEARGAEEAARRAPIILGVPSFPVSAVERAQRSVREQDARVAHAIIPGLRRAVEIIRSIRLVPREDVEGKAVEAPDVEGQ